MILDSDKIYAKLLAAGDDFADKNAAAELLEETKKVILAQIMTKYSGAVNSKETQALADPEYGTHIRAMVEARRLANRAKAMLDSLKTLSELRRSEESSRRAEMQIR